LCPGRDAAFLCRSQDPDRSSLGVRNGPGLQRTTRYARAALRPGTRPRQFNPEFCTIPHVETSRGVRNSTDSQKARMPIGPAPLHPSDPAMPLALLNSVFGCRFRGAQEEIVRHVAVRRQLAGADGRPAAASRCAIKLPGAVARTAAASSDSPTERSRLMRASQARGW